MHRPLQIYLFFEYWAVLFSFSCLANIVGLNISSAFNSVKVIYIIVPLIIIPQLLFSGVIVKFDKLNQKLYAIESGFISRIKVSSGSYGNAIYITHPNDKVSVYAHLNSYISKISELVKKEQYLKKSFEIEIFPKPNTFLIKKNELIGFSGNTGNSTGPHLHFEIRDEHSELPINPLEFYKTNDKSAQVISQIAFYDI